MNQCLTCSDVSLTFTNGECKRDTPCPTGFFHDTVCKPCSTYCSTCVNTNVCTTCIDGFQIEELSFPIPGSLPVAFCVEICGDGKRFESSCDDGNTVNGDGCDDNCNVEDGWTCQGGSSIRQSSCSHFIPTRTIIIPKGKVALFGKVVFAVNLSYLPTNLTAHDCP